MNRIFFIRKLLNRSGPAQRPSVRIVKALGGALLMLSAARAPALGPHELLLLVNEASEASVEIAEAYARLRGVPERNIVRVRIPLENDAAPMEMTPSQFTELVWNPANAFLEQQELERQVLAWVYSVDFPLRIATRPPLSLTGLTFTRNQIPDPEVVNSGSFASPLYAGPDRQGRFMRATRSLDVSREEHKDAMPLPAMALGYTGRRGNTRAEILDSLQRGKASDESRPTGTVYFVLRDDVRSKAREWQYKPVIDTLAKLEVEARMVESWPTERDDAIGLMTGAADLRPDRMGGFLPGAWTEHLTSYGAAFDRSSQTKLSVWIRAGATASAGTVTEPYSIWTKFPHARLFEHYARGCTILESFYQAVRAPLQIVPIGDPLARPWSPPARISIQKIERGPTEDHLRITTSVHSERGERYRQTLFLLEGRPLAPAREQVEERIIAHDHVRRTFVVEAGPPKSRPRALRAVAYRSGRIRRQVFDECTLDR